MPPDTTRGADAEADPPIEHTPDKTRATALRERAIAVSSLTSYFKERVWWASEDARARDGH